MTDAVYEPAYEPYEGERTTRTRRIAAIARRGLGEVAGSTWFWALLGISLVHVAVRGVVLYVTGQGPQAGPTQIQFTGSFLTDALATQARWLLTFVLAAIGAEVIAEDLQAGGLTFYFTKPISKPGYLAGKLAGPFTAALAVTAFPALVLWLLGVAFTPEAAYPSNVWMLPLALVAASLVASVFATLVVAALSGLVGSSGRTAVVWIAAVVVLAGASRVADAVTGNPDTLLIDPYNAIDKATQVLAGVEASAVPGLGAWLTIAGWILASLAGLAWTLDQEEVAG